MQPPSKDERFHDHIPSVLLLKNAEFPTDDHGEIYVLLFHDEAMPVHLVFFILLSEIRQHHDLIWENVLFVLFCVSS